MLGRGWVYEGVTRAEEGEGCDCGRCGEGQFINNYEYVCKFKKYFSIFTICLVFALILLVLLSDLFNALQERLVSAPAPPCRRGSAPPSRPAPPQTKETKPSPRSAPPLATPSPEVGRRRFTSLPRPSEMPSAQTNHKFKGKRNKIKKCKLEFGKVL